MVCRMLLRIPSRCWPVAPHAATHLAWHCQTHFFWTFLLSLYGLIEAASVVSFCQNATSLTSPSVCSPATFPIHENFKHGLWSSHMELLLCSQLRESIFNSEVLFQQLASPLLIPSAQDPLCSKLSVSILIPDSISYASSHSHLIFNHDQHPGWVCLCVCVCVWGGGGMSKCVYENVCECVCVCVSMHECVWENVCVYECMYENVWMYV